MTSNLEISILDFVHPIENSPTGNTFRIADSHPDHNGNIIPIEPPLHVIFVDKGEQVAFIQGSLAARYTEEQLRQIGNGETLIGIHDVIGEIAIQGGLVKRAIKPLHPTLIDAKSREKQHSNQ